MEGPLTLVCCEGGAIHGLAQHLDGQQQCTVQVNVLFVLLLQNGLC